MYFGAPDKLNICHPLALWLQDEMVEIHPWPSHGWDFQPPPNHHQITVSLWQSNMVCWKIRENPLNTAIILGVYHRLPLIVFPWEHFARWSTGVKLKKRGADVVTHQAFVPTKGTPKSKPLGLVVLKHGSGKWTIYHLSVICLLVMVWGCCLRAFKLDLQFFRSTMFIRHVPHGYVWRSRHVMLFFQKLGLQGPGFMVKAVRSSDSYWLAFQAPGSWQLDHSISRGVFNRRSWLCVIHGVISLEKRWHGWSFVPTRLERSLDNLNVSSCIC